MTVQTLRGTRSFPDGRGTFAPPTAPRSPPSTARSTWRVGGALVFEAGPGLEHAAVLERVGRRLHLIPRYRQRLVEAPLGLAEPGVGRRRGASTSTGTSRRAPLPAPGGPTSWPTRRPRDVAPARPLAPAVGAARRRRARRRAGRAGAEDAPRARRRRGRGRHRHRPARPLARAAGHPAARRALGAAPLRPRAPPRAAAATPFMRAQQLLARRRAARAGRDRPRRRRRRPAPRRPTCSPSSPRSARRRR